MADNKLVDNGTGTDYTVASDEIGGVDYQRVKLVDGTADSTAAIPGDATNGLDVDVTRIQAGTNLIGKVAAGNTTDVVYNGTTALTPKYAFFSTSSSGEQQVIALVAAKKLRVLAFTITGAGTATGVTFRTGSGGTAISAAYQVVSTLPTIVAPYCPVGWFETAAGERLSVNNSAAQSITIHVVYVEV